MKHSVLLAGLIVLCMSAEALALSESDMQTFYNESAEYRKADRAIKDAVNTVMEKGTAAQIGALRESQRYWLGKERDAAVASIPTSLSPAQKYALVTKVRAVKMQAFARQAENRDKPITLTGKAARLNDLGGGGWGICTQTEIKDATQSSCFYVAHYNELEEDKDKATRALLDEAVETGRQLAVTGQLASPEGFLAKTVQIANVSEEGEKPQTRGSKEDGKGASAAGKGGK